MRGFLRVPLFLLYILLIPAISFTLESVNESGFIFMLDKKQVPIEALREGNVFFVKASSLAKTLGIKINWKPNKPLWIGGTRIEESLLKFISSESKEPYIPVRLVLQKLGFSYNAFNINGVEKILVTTRPVTTAAHPVVQAPHSESQTAVSKPATPGLTMEVLSEDIVTVLAPNEIKAIDDPSWVEADKATIADDTPVIGVTVNGRHRAYSINILNYHEIVNDELGGKKIAVTW